tara:strand:- start:19244 stop:19528 length:285 start_codon:yes stop_codon:yes gene_type:complete
MEKNKKEKNGYDPNITEEEKRMLGDRREHLRRDGGDDDQLRRSRAPIDFEAKDLDIPGRDQASPKKKEGKLKDEENQHYAQGGPRKENLENDSN